MTPKKIENEEVKTEETGIDENAVEVDTEEELASGEAVGPAEIPESNTSRLNPGSGGNYRLIDGKYVPII